MFLFSQFQQGNSQHSLGEQHYPKYSPSLYRLKMGVNQTQRTLRNIRINNPKMCPHMCFQFLLKDHRWGLASTKISDCQHCHPITAFYRFKITVYSKACFNRTESLAFQHGSSKTPLNVILSSSFETVYVFIKWSCILDQPVSNQGKLCFPVDCTD